MKVLVAGADGFIGTHVCRCFKQHGHKVYMAIRGLENSSDEGVVPEKIGVDLTEEATVFNAIKRCQPDIIVNCAGIVGTDGNVDLNMVFTKNILEAAVQSGIDLKRIIIIGSAAEYGAVPSYETLVNEDAPRNPISGYGMSKRGEVDFALLFAKQHGLPLVVARVFNPIGVGMSPRFLAFQLLKQINDIKNGGARNIEVIDADAKRDYIDVRDVAEAIVGIAEGEPKNQVYNVGTSVATSNGTLVEIFARYSGLTDYAIVDTATKTGAAVAARADIGRMQKDFDWSPRYLVEDAVKEVVDAK